MIEDLVLFLVFAGSLFLAIRHIKQAFSSDSGGACNGCSSSSCSVEDDSGEGENSVLKCSNADNSNESRVSTQ